MNMCAQILAAFVAYRVCLCISQGAISHDVQGRVITIATEKPGLELRLKYDGRCLFDRVVVRGRSIVSETNGVCSGVKVANQWYTTRTGLAEVGVTTASNAVDISGIRFGGGGIQVEENWLLTVHLDRIDWRISRDYVSGGLLEDTYFPGWEFNDLSTWTGALLGHGGVAWCRLFDALNASYGVHNGQVVFWNKDSGDGLRIDPHALSGEELAVRFTRQPSCVFSFNYSVSPLLLVPQHGLSRFKPDRQDIWVPFQVTPGHVVVEYSLTPFEYDKTYDLGQLRGLSSSTVREIRHTIARIGAVDERIHGSNGYYSDCAVLHEPWLAQLGLFINDPAYTGHSPTRWTSNVSMPLASTVA
jgi:hypothetical protein